jgi:protease I
MKLKGKKVLLLLEDQYEDLEYWYPRIRMKEEGAQVFAAGSRKAVFTGKHGLPAHADGSIEEIELDEYHGLIIPGGYSPDRMRRSRAMVDAVRQMHQAGRVVAAICHGGWMLASAGVLRGRKATSFFSIKDDMVNAGADWVDEEVVVDGNLITSRRPDDLPAFCRAIIRELGGSERVS